ncbi:MAG: response regulator transcription factor [Microbacterium sp.]|uniref:winged helix-turn-helix domain-containing protein n=1 Tax=Microbacterium sp. TaxID=51671 RepID=UPI0019926E0C|nr:winged helix-turn-helix domain-containing protein [Microbacterium sp.]MBD3757088.1 response regulator transcription factor [Microbacterium sp.]
MSLAAVRGADRAVLLTRTVDVRGTTAEFRHVGVTVVSHDDILHALLELTHDPDSILVVSSDFDRIPLPDMLDLAVAVCGPSVILGLGTADAAASIRTAFAAGVRTTVELPLTPERLQQAIHRLPQSPSARDAAVTVGDLTVDPGRHLALWRGVPIEVTPREFAILHALTTAHPYLATLEQLAVEYAGTATDPIASIRVAIKRIRTRLAEAGARPNPAIETVRGVGYRLAC